MSLPPRLTVLALGVSAVPAWAADAGVQTSAVGSLLQALLGLAVVLALLYGFFWVLRRFGPGQTGAQGAVKVVGGVMLGPRERLVVVEVQDTWLLVGVAAGHVSTLHTLPKPDHVELPPREPAAPFAAKLAEFLGRPRG